MAKFVFLMIIVLSATAWLYLLHRFAPSLSENEDIAKTLKFPHNLEELQNIAKNLKIYSINHWWYVFLIFSSAYIYKQAFCIPGSIFLNLLAGALYGQIGGLFFACTFTAIGASICYILSSTFAKQAILKYFSKQFLNLQEKVKQNENDLFFFMLLIRLVPITPGWVINIVAPLIKVPIFLFFITTFLGLVPYNFVGVGAGGMLSSLKSVQDVFTWKVVLNLSMLGIIGVGPAYLLNKVAQKKIKSI